MTTPENTHPIQGKFQKGQSGNPAGKPKGARHKTTMAIQALLDGEAEAITRKAIEAANAGDMTAIKMVLERVLPPRKDRPMAFDMPEMANVADAAKAMAAIVAAVAKGDIAPSEASEAAKLVGQYIEVVKMTDLEQRIRQLEQGQR